MSGTAGAVVGVNGAARAVVGVAVVGAEVLLVDDVDVAAVDDVLELEVLAGGVVEVLDVDAATVVLDAVAMVTDALGAVDVPLVASEHAARATKPTATAINERWRTPASVAGPVEREPDPAPPAVSIAVNACDHHGHGRAVRHHLGCLHRARPVEPPA
jgi:hypothetical protein